jgi:hypothetical protein
MLWLLRIDGWCNAKALTSSGSVGSVSTRTEQGGASSVGKRKKGKKVPALK